MALGSLVQPEQRLPGTCWVVRATNTGICLWCANGYSSARGRMLPRLPIGACRERTRAELAAIGNPVYGPGKPASRAQITSSRIRRCRAPTGPPALRRETRQSRARPHARHPRQHRKERIP